MSSILVERAGPLTTIQDRGRFGALRYGISASGPMDGGAFALAGAMLRQAGSAGIEFTRAGLAFTVEGAAVEAALAGGAFAVSVNGQPRPWPARLGLEAGDRVEVTPGPRGNYGYLRFSQEIDVPEILGSRATNIVAGLGGYNGRALKAGDWLTLAPGTTRSGLVPDAAAASDLPIRVLWGLHADLFDAEARLAFEGAPFEISTQLDRMGVRLVAPSATPIEAHGLSLVSDAIVPGDIQILGDGTPIVLMRDHQPTGGYPRIATIVGPDLDRFAQLRPGSAVRFDPITPRRARELVR